MQIVVENPGSVAAIEDAFCAATGIARDAVSFYHNIDDFIAGPGEPWVEVIPIEGDFQLMLQTFAPWAEAYDEDAVAQAMSKLLATRTAVPDADMPDKLRLYVEGKRTGTIYLADPDSPDGYVIGKIVAS